MKKTLIALAALGAMAGVAHAQSTVTLYGLLDGNIQSYKTNVVVGTGAGATVQSLTQTKINDGGLNGSRWGMRVKEDIGGGMFVVGNLESGFSIDTGASTTGGSLHSASSLFSRRANVGVSSGFGTLVIGRNSSSYDDVSGDHAMMIQSIFDPSNTNNGPSVATVATTAGALSLLNRNTTWVGYNTRFNNSVKYDTPNFSGFSGSVMYAFGEDKNSANSASKTVSANLKFSNGPLLISGGYQSEAPTNTLVNVGKPALQNTLVSVAYDLGVAKIGAGFNRAKFKDVAPGVSVDAQKEWNLSVAVPLGATTLSAGYAQSKGDTLGKSSGFGIQALYALSKRSTLYAGAQSTKNYDKLANAVLLSSPGSSIGRTQTYGLGLRHTF